MSVKFIGPSRQEFLQAVRYYNGAQAGLGNAFRSEVLQSLLLLQENPLAFALVGKRTRKYVTPRFKYLIIYQALSEGLRILAIVDSRRDPDFWRSRLGKGD